VCVCICACMCAYICMRALCECFGVFVWPKDTQQYKSLVLLVLLLNLYTLITRATYRIHTQACMRMYASVCMQAYVCMHVCVNACIHAHTYIYNLHTYSFYMKTLNTEDWVITYIIIHTYIQYYILYIHNYTLHYANCYRLQVLYS